MNAAPPLRLVPTTESQSPSECRSESRSGSRSGSRSESRSGPLGREPLWREVLGARLRHLRRRHGLTLVAAATRAGISPQYLSEVERGRKDPSSEVLAAITGALGEQLVEVTHLASLDLRRQHHGLAAPPPGEIRLSA